MRLIKFRGQSAATREWVYGWLYHDQVFKDGKSCVDIYLIRNDCDEDCEVDEKTIGEFTGLLDKNGKEIYEGDIVKFETLDADKNRELIGVIEYCRSSFMVFVKDWGLCNFYDPMIEVIGNIYETPELLK